MQKWEYMFIGLPHSRTESGKVAGEKVERIPQIEAVLNELGKQGWEIVGHSYIVRAQLGGGMGEPFFALKRPIDVAG